MKVTRRDFKWAVDHGLIERGPAERLWEALAGLSLLTSWDIEEIGQMHLYMLICVGMMLISVLLQRRVLLVFGAIGVVCYLGFLSWEVFRDSLIFPFLLTVIGLAIIWLGIEYRKHQEMIEKRVLERLPHGVTRWLPWKRTPPG